MEAVSYAHLGIEAVHARRVHERWVYRDPEGIWRRTYLSELAALGARLAAGEPIEVAYAAWRAGGNACESLSVPPEDMPACAS